MGREHDEGDFVTRINRLARQCDVHMERASRWVDKLEAEAAVPLPRRRSTRLDRLFDRAERHVQSMVADASRPRARRPRKARPHKDAVAEMARRLEELRACLMDVEAERDQASDFAVEWHRRVLLAKRLRSKSLVREALLYRFKHEMDYARSAREARKLSAILDEMRRAAETIASLGGEPLSRSNDPETR